MNTIRSALKEDAPFILSLINKLAEFEKRPEQVNLTLNQFISDGFSTNPLFECIILLESGEKIGFALFYYRYSTWKGKTLYLEDLYILPNHRGNGLGVMAMKYLAKYAMENNCHRFEWQVLDWNEPSINFYKGLGTDLDPEWINCRLEGAAISNLAGI